MPEPLNIVFNGFGIWLKVGYWSSVVYIFQQGIFHRCCVAIRYWWLCTFLC